jgi:ABC-2 type transport system ATP-binding protein
MIETRRLTKRFGEKVVVSALDLRVEPGEILGFLGVNGAGKSTTVKILTGLIPATSGGAFVAGYDIEREPLEAKKRFGYVPETPKLYESLTADAFLDIIGTLYHLDPKVSRARRNDLVALFGLGDVRHQRLREFSKGMRQKVVIAAALLHRPQVLILDEPFDGLDANAALVMKGVLREMAEQGKTILFSSHILEVVERICTRICIIDKGCLIAGGTAEEIRRETGAATLDEAFGRLTGVRDASSVTADILAALGNDASPPPGPGV